MISQDTELNHHFANAPARFLNGERYELMMTDQTYPIQIKTSDSSFVLLGVDKEDNSFVAVKIYQKGKRIDEQWSSIGSHYPCCCCPCACCKSRTDSNECKIDSAIVWCSDNLTLADSWTPCEFAFRKTLSLKRLAQCSQFHGLRGAFRVLISLHHL